MNRFSDKENYFLDLKVLCRFIDNFQPTNSNVKLLQCYSIFLTSLNPICTKVKNTPQPCDDSAHQRTLQETLHTPNAIYIYVCVCGNFSSQLKKK